MILVGELSLWLALLMSAWSSTVSIVGGVQGRGDLMRSGARSMFVTCGFLALALAGVLNALLARDFSMVLVAANTSNNLPVPYTIAALWADTSGTLLLVGTVISAFGCAALLTRSRRSSETNSARESLAALTSTAQATGIIALATCCVIVVMCFIANPYMRVGGVLPDGRGLDSRLQTPGMLFQPPLMYVAVSALVVPIALALTIAFKGHRDTGVQETVARWLVTSWFLQTNSLLFGMWRVYTESGSPVYWESSNTQKITLLLWLLTSACVAWYSLRKPRHQRQRLGLKLLALGMVFTVCAAVGGRLATRLDATLSPGDSFNATDRFGGAWTFASQGTSRFGARNWQVLAVNLRVTRAGEVTGFVSSDTRQTVDDSGEPTSEPIARVGVQRTLAQDIYFVLDRVAADDRAQFHLYFVPLVWCAWLGGVIFAFGGLIAMWPVGDVTRESARTV